LARAKRTDRTEARRRYRAEQAALAGDSEPVDEEADDADGSRSPSAPRRRSSRSSKSDRTSGSTSSSAQQRPGLINAMRSAVRPLDWRSDVRSLPMLVRHWSFWLPSLLAVATTVAFFVVIPAGTSTTAGNPAASGSGGIFVTLVYFAFQMFVFPLPAPVGAAFLAGFGAPRASWLTGALVGVVSAISFSIVVLSPTYADAVGDGSSAIGLAIQGLIAAPLGSALFASLAAWYRRFLNLANPNRSQRPSKPQRGRGNMKTNSRA
jgi:hypothetical protein